ncbi:MAG: hypothetical protein U5S82_18680 [Gammaproteobacteria bacterium]|nr:hypothetical protein [Gammaproteobacteria bacterium]
MKYFKLTVAQTEMDHERLGVHNLISLFGGFAIAFGVALTSGFWYGLIPRDLNWNASQTVLLLHLAAGLMATILLPAFYVLHQRHKDQPLSLLLTPWRLRPQADESAQRYRQRCLGHLLTWCLLLVFGSGLLIAVPGLLFYLGLVWMQGYYLVQSLVWLHLWSSVLLLPLLFTHLLWIAGKGEDAR